MTRRAASDGQGDSRVEHAEEGGEAPCSAHLFEENREPLDDRTLADLARNLADAIVVADPGGDIVFWNDAAARLFGWSAEEALGRSLDLIIPDRLQDRHWEGYRKTMATGHTEYGGRLLEVPAVHRDGHTMSIAFTVTLLRQPGRPTPSAIAAVIRDDSVRWQERRRIKEELGALRAERAPRE